MVIEVELEELEMWEKGNLLVGFDHVNGLYPHELPAKLLFKQVGFRDGG